MDKLNDARKYSPSSNDNEFEPYTDILYSNLKKNNGFSPGKSHLDYLSGISSKENEHTNYDARMIGKNLSESLKKKEVSQANLARDRKIVEYSSNPNQKEYNKTLEDSFAKLQIINQQIATANANKQKAKNLEKNESVLDQYRSLSLAYSNSQQKILELEESLKLETINSEEQRAYIEMLKESLEKKIGNMGITEFLKTAATQAQSNHIDLFIQFQNIQERIENQQVENQRYEQQIYELENMNQGLQAENEELKQTQSELMVINSKINDDVKSTLNSLADIKKENKTLHSDKESLLDYIDELKNNYEKLESQLSEKSMRNNEVNEELKKYSNHLNNTVENARNTEKELIDKKNELLKMSQNFEDLKKYSDKVRLNMDEVVQENSNLLSRLTEAQAQIQELQSQKNRDGADLNEMEQQLISMRDEFEEIKQRNDELEGFRQRTDELDEMNQQANSALEEGRLRFEKEREQLGEEIKQIYEQLSKTRTELRETRDEKHRLFLEKEHLSNELNAYKDLNGKKHQTIESIFEENSNLKNIIEKQVKEIEDLRISNQGYLNDINESKEIFRRMEKDIEELFREKENARKQIKKQNDDFEGTSEKLKNAEKKLREITKSESELKEKAVKQESLRKILKMNLLSMNKTMKKAEKLDLNSKIDWLENLAEGDDNEDKIQQIFTSFQQNIASLVEDNNSLSRNYQKVLENLETNQIQSSNQLEDLKNENVALLQEIEKLQEENGLINEDLKNIREENNEIISLVQEKTLRAEANHESELKELEEKWISTSLEKNSLDFLKEKLKGFLFNSEIVELIHEMIDVLKQLNKLEKEKIAIERRVEEESMAQANLQEGQSKRGLTNTTSPQRKIFYETGKLRRLEELKDLISELDTNIKIQEAKKNILDAELEKLEKFEKNRYINISHLEKTNTQQKNEISILLNELDLKELARKNLEKAYNDLLNDYRRLTNETAKGKDTSTFLNKKDQSAFEELKGFSTTSKYRSTARRFNNLNSEEN